MVYYYEGIDYQGKEILVSLGNDNMIFVETLIPGQKGEITPLFPEPLVPGELLNLRYTETVLFKLQHHLNH